jgi:hypothetical protein
MDSRNCQTAAASPAKPGGLLRWASVVFPTNAGLSAFAQNVTFGSQFQFLLTLDGPAITARPTASPELASPCCCTNPTSLRRFSPPLSPVRSISIPMVPCHGRYFRP